jgi:hypothetical protein
MNSNQKGRGNRTPSSNKTTLKEPIRPFLTELARLEAMEAWKTGEALDVCALKDKTIIKDFVFTKRNSMGLGLVLPNKANLIGFPL